MDKIKNIQVYRDKESQASSKLQCNKCVVNIIFLISQTSGELLWKVMY